MRGGDVALVHPALRHRGQLVVPGQVRHLQSGRQVLAFILSVLDVLSDGVVGLEDLGLVVSRYAPRCDGAARGGGTIVGVQTHGVVRLGVTGVDLAVVGRIGRHGNRQEQKKYGRQHLQNCEECGGGGQLLLGGTIVEQRR